MAIRHIVFDTNCWISYFYNDRFEKLVELKTDHQITFYTCQQQWDELLNVVSRPRFSKRFSSPFEQYPDFAKMVSVFLEIDERFDRSADPKDNYLIDLAYTSKADHIISSDHHLLQLKHIGKIQIISLSDFKKKLGLDY
jgi:putative PIN family toxin of toxin-antitoxin system